MIDTLRLLFASTSSPVSFLVSQPADENPQQQQVVKRKKQEGRLWVCDKLAVAAAAAVCLSVCVAANLTRARTFLLALPVSSFHQLPLLPLLLWSVELVGWPTATASATQNEPTSEPYWQLVWVCASTIDWIRLAGSLYLVQNHQVPTRAAAAAAVLQHKQTKLTLNWRSRACLPIGHCIQAY